MKRMPQDGRISLKLGGRPIGRVFLAEATEIDLHASHEHDRGRAKALHHIEKLVGVGQIQYLRADQDTQDNFQHDNRQPKPDSNLGQQWRDECREQDDEYRMSMVHAFPEVTNQ